MYNRCVTHGRWVVQTLYSVRTYLVHHKCVIIIEANDDIVWLSWFQARGHWSYIRVRLVSPLVLIAPHRQQQLHECLQVQRRCLRLACWWCSWPFGAFHSAGLKRTTDANSPAIYSTSTNCRPIKSLSVRCPDFVMIFFFVFLSRNNESSSTKRDVLIDFYGRGNRDAICSAQIYATIELMISSFYLRFFFLFFFVLIIIWLLFDGYRYIDARRDLPCALGE